MESRKNALVSKLNASTTMCHTAHQGIGFGFGMKAFVTQPSHESNINININIAVPGHQPGPGEQALLLITGGWVNENDLDGFAYTANGDAATRYQTDAKVVVRGAATFKMTPNGQGLLVGLIRRRLFDCSDNSLQAALSCIHGSCVTVLAPQVNYVVVDEGWRGHGLGKLMVASAQKVASEVRILMRQ